METLKFLVLIPPQDIELKLQSLRSDIFSQYGYTSALVLPIMVPFFSVHPGIPGDDIKRAFESFHCTGFTMTTSHLVNISGSLFIKIAECIALSDLIAKCRRLFIQLSRDKDIETKNGGFICFPFYTGFYLARNEQAIPVIEMGIKIPDPKAITFKKYTISVLNVNIYSGLETWWENIDWELTFQVKSKKEVS